MSTNTPSVIFSVKLTLDKCLEKNCRQRNVVCCDDFVISKLKAITHFRLWVRM